MLPDTSRRILVSNLARGIAREASEKRKGGDRGDGFGDKPMTRRPCLFIAVALVVMFAPSCALLDEPAPWDTAEIVRDVTKSLRDNELLTSDLERTEILAWRILTSTADDRDPIPLKRVSRMGVVLLWGRARVGTGAPGWLLVEVYRLRSDDRWERPIVNINLNGPLRHPVRPGELPDGTLTGVQLYDHPPTSREACAFAAVQYLDAERRPDSLQMEQSVVRKRAWVSLTGSDPACDMTK
jgi:hypothetical protein